MASSNLNPNSPSMDGESAFVSSVPEAGTTVEVDFGDATLPKNVAVGYWSTRGLGAPIAMMLCAARVPFTYFLFDLIEVGETGSPDSWTSDYFAAKHRFAEREGQPLFNLPFCADRAKRRMLYQSNAISMHLGKAYGMLDRNDEKTCSECEQLLGEIYDLRNVLNGYVYGLRRDDAARAIASARSHLWKFEGWLEHQPNSHLVGAGVKGRRGPAVPAALHLLNGRFTPPDFHLWELLDQLEALTRELFGDADPLYRDLPRIRAFKEGFGALPENGAYLGSWLHTGLPFNNCMAHFGSLPGPDTYAHRKSAPIATWRNRGVVALSLR